MTQATACFSLDKLAGDAVERSPCRVGKIVCSNIGRETDLDRADTIVDAGSPSATDCGQSDRLCCPRWIHVGVRYSTKQAVEFHDLQHALNVAARTVIATER